MNLKKVKIRKYLLLFFVAGVAIHGYGQQEAQFTQYMYNTQIINPAYAGSRDVLSLTGLYRTQWVGLDGAPKTATFSGNTPINERLGIGLSVVNDKIGPSNENNIAVDISYNIPVGENYRLFFGIKPAVDLLNIDYTKLDIYDPNDPNYQFNVDRKFSPNIGAGVYLQSDKAYIGLSVPSLLETNHYNHSSTSYVQDKMHAYIIGGYVFDLSYNLKFKPAVLAKIVPGAPVAVDMSANFLYNEKLTLGVSYRWSAAVSAMVGFQITPGLMAGYAYDTDTTDLGSYNSGSHELFLRFEIFKYNLPVLNPRFF